MARRCGVCLVDMGYGQAIFTAECSHSFHLRCTHHLTACPLCHAPWRDTPGAAPAVFDDDEPLELPPPPPPPRAGRDAVDQAANGVNGVMVLKTHCEYPAVARDAARDGFAVLVHAKAPSAAAPAARRAPLDLVTVLDVSGSMAGRKLALVKQAVGFVVDKLGPDDRLSIVSFSSNARRLTRLTRMSGAGRAASECAVESLVTSGGTNIGGGLREAARVLDGRRHRNAVAAIILLSDGQDNYTVRPQGGFGTSTDYSALVPPSLTRAAGGDSSSPPVHTFGFGADHDSAAMHTIAEATGGTFSFVENEAVIQDSFAQCIGGLLSVAVQEARLAVKCMHPGVRVRSIKSGRYVSRVDADGRAASVDVGELYADEERRFLVMVDVPRAGDADGATPLVKVSCTYRDAANGQSVDVAGEDAAVERPVEVAACVEPCVEVERERLRVEAAEDIAAARAAAERGEHVEAARMLMRRGQAVERSARGDARFAELASEVGELSARVADRREYEQSGRACLLSGMSSHGQQRASSAKLYGGGALGGSAAYATPAMRSMVDSSEKTRREQQQRHQPPPPSLAMNSMRKCHRFLRLK